MLNHILHFLFSPIRPYETTSPIYYQLKNRSLTNLWGWKPFSTVMYALPNLRGKHTALDINERIIEIPWIFSQFDFSASPAQKEKIKILDVGCSESTVSLSLATGGYTVTGIDLRENKFKYPHFTALQGDICQTKLPSQSFDIIILLSTLEHIGLQTLYGNVPETSTDQFAIDECYRLLKKKGTLLITTPIAKKPYQDSFMRRYTPQQLQFLLKRFTIQEMQYVVPNTARTVWQQATEKELPNSPKFGVALIKAQKA